MTRRGRAARATGPSDVRRRELPDKPPTFADPPGSVEEGIGRRQSVFRVPQKPHGSCGSLVDPLVRESVEDPGAPARCVMVRPDATGRSAGGDGADESPCHGSGMTGFVEGLESPGTTAVEPEREGSSVFPTEEAVDHALARVRGRRAPEPGRRSGHGDVSRPPPPKGRSSRNPRSGSGPSVPARPEGGSRRGSEKLRGRTVAGEATPRTTDLSGPRRWRGEKPQEGRSGPCRTGEDVATRTLRGRRSLWKPSHCLRAVRQADRRNTSRSWKRRGGSGNP
jgi:hypothetical protein